MIIHGDAIIRICSVFCYRDIRFGYHQRPYTADENERYVVFVFVEGDFVIYARKSYKMNETTHTHTHMIITHNI